MRKRAPSKIVIGRHETVDLPLLGLRRVVAKVDTGAFHSALHCERIEWVRRGRRKVLRVTFPGSPKAVELTSRRKVGVRSSFGETEERHLIRTAIEIGAVAFLADFTLADRRSQRHRVLLGREALKGRFLIDVGRRLLMGSPGGES